MPTKRQFLSLVAAGLLTLGVAGTASAQPDQAAATVSHECVDGTGQGTVTVNGDIKSTQTVPNDRSQGRGPCLPPPGQER
jgi:hypothetical protein